VPASHRLGAEGTGFRQVMQGFDYNRVGIALACLGTAQVSLEETMAYVRERQAFGKSLASFEGVSFAIAEAATHIDACRWLCYRALWLADHGRPYTKESAMTKWWAPRLAADTIHQCLLLHGHYGYTSELPLEQRLRDVIGLEIGDGTAEVMKMIVARELMGRESLPY
jgi:cyclohexanecarboxyl-CoA dehydrogenase